MITSISPNFKAANAVFLLQETLNNQIFVGLSDIERLRKHLNDILNVIKLQLMYKKQAMEYLNIPALDNTLLMNHLLGI
ncbi:hypothetical protein PR048_016483 [Dryococelus australis]|uniref:Uncharacterized protein n=1 Tax=Dryococelus australis TaxID=614101 RepID=A0ABQ9HJT8_9NEOP|nr:hypothetical protein PR048_016483 [Dryococelus australis]